MGETVENSLFVSPIPIMRQPPLEMTSGPDSIESLCRRLEENLPLSNREILAEFGLLEGHPWEHHVRSPSTNYYACLYALAKSVHPKRILEIGTGFGLSAAALLKACEMLELLVSLDLGIFGEQHGWAESNLVFARRTIHRWCTRQGIPPEKVKFFQANTQPPGRSDNDNVACRALHWSEVPELTQLLVPETFDLLFVDGKHTENGLYNDLKTFWPFLRPGGLLICDDLHDESFREFFPWAGDTLRSFSDFISEFSAHIAGHHIWPFPRVLPPTREGMRPFGIIRKKPAERALLQTPAGRPTRLESRELPDFASLIAALARNQRRLYLRDQSPRTLAALVKLAQSHQPTKIIELGTLSGLSLRAWLAAGTQAEIVAVDLSFAALHQSLKVAPLDLSRVRLLEQDILKTDFRRLWEPHDRVLLYVDAHDQPDSPIMEHLLAHALPLLPPGSLVVVDDLWHSPETLSAENAGEFFRRRVMDDIDPLQCFAGHFAPYWRGGCFMGFAEVQPLLAWVNARKISLHFHQDHKFVSFAWPADGGNPERMFEKARNAGTAGCFSFHPLADAALLGAGSFTIDGPTLLALSLKEKALDLYGRGLVAEALACLGRACDYRHQVGGFRYAQAVCLARLGRFAEALACLEEELCSPFPHGRTLKLGNDIRDWLRAEKLAPVTEITPTVASVLTIFACPKAFQGHAAVLQKNAIASWTRLSPRPEIILCGNDPGVAEVARELGLRHVPEVELSRGGTPLVRHVFQAAQNLATSPILAYVNADIILGPDFMDAAAKAREQFPSFLMIGRRRGVDLKDLIDFAGPDWRENLIARAADSGTLHAVSALDYFVFTKNLWPEIPDFALGRTAWDNWLAAQPLLAGTPVIDATPFVTAIHQNHDYGHVQGGQEAAWKGEEASRNQDLAWTSPFLAYSSHATWEMTPGGYFLERKVQQQFMALGREGWAFLQEGKPEAALARFEEMLRLHPEGIPGLHYIRALALEKLGRKGEARAALEKELASHPTHRRARDLLTFLEDTGEETAIGNPKISVVIPTYNRAHFLAEAVQSVLSQAYDDLEVLVVDDGSTDDTPAVLARFDDPRVRYLRKEKTGAPDSRNWGIANASGEWILWLDSDDALMPGWLARLESMLADGDPADVYYGNLVVVDAAGRPLKTLRYEDFDGCLNLLLPRLLQGNPLPQPGTLVRASLLRDAGGFDTAFPRAHDYELWSRLAPVARFKHLNFLALKWRWHDTNMSSGSVPRDLSYEAEIVKRLLKRHPLKDFFPDLDWEDWPRAQAQAARTLSDIFLHYGDEEAAREWLKESAGLSSRAQTPAECAAHG